MIGHLLNSSVTVYRATYADDGRGGRIKSMAVVSTIRAKIDQAMIVMERQVAAEFGATLTHIVHVSYAADVRRLDELDDGGARRLRVQAVLSDSHRTYKRLQCELIQGE
jgi:head-tail adaptor